MKRWRLVMAGMALAVLAAAAPARAVSEWQFSDWSRGAAKPGFPAWLLDNPAAKEEVADAVRYEAYTGYPDDTLRLTSTITRAEFATALTRVLGDDPGPAPGDAWWTPYVKRLAERGITGAGGDWTAPISRGEMARWMGRAALAEKVPTLPLTFPDLTDRDALAAAGAGVIRGYDDGLFHPDRTAERVHAALMLVRLLKILPGELPTAEELIAIKKAADTADTVASRRLAKEGPPYDTAGVAPYLAPGFLRENKKYSESIYQLHDAGWGIHDPSSYGLEEFVFARGHVAIIRISLVSTGYKADGTLRSGPKKYTGEIVFVKRAGKWVMCYGRS